MTGFPSSDVAMGSGGRPAAGSERRRNPVIEFTPVEPGHFPMLWEWTRRPHVARWFQPWMPSTYEAAAEEWTQMLDGRLPWRGFLIVVEGQQVGWIQSYRLSAAPEMAQSIGLGRDAVAADLYIAEVDHVGRGLGPQVVARFYLRMMAETGLSEGIIDPEAENRRAIRAYEKGGFRFLCETGDDVSGHRDHIMWADRQAIENALRQL